MNFLRNMKLGKKIYAGYIIILILMTSVSVVVYSSITSIIDASKWVNHTYVVIRTGEDVAGAMVDMETGQRGFMVTGIDEYLEPYNDGIVRFDRLIKKGKELTSDNTAQVERWRKVAELKTEWVQEVAQTEIKARRQVTLGASATANFKTISARTVGKDIFDGIRGVLANLEAKFLQASSTQGAHLITLLTLDLVNMETGQRGFLLTGKEESLEPYNGGQISFQQNIEKLGSVMKGTTVTREETIELQSRVNDWLSQAAQPEIDARREMNRFSTSIDDIAIMMEQGKGKLLMDTIRARIREIVAEEEKLIIVRGDQQTASSAIGIGVTIIGTLIAIAISSTIAFFIVRGIMQPINATNTILKNITEQGDLTKRVAITSGDEIGEMGEYFNAFVSKLQGIIREIVESATQLSVAAEQMSKVAADTNEGLNRQNSETVQVATAMTEMAATVDEIARNSQNGSDAASSSDREAKSGNQAVSITIKTINELAGDVENSAMILENLKGDSENISAVLDVIKNIADQTNLLALNAAIEAARAGEQGRGFAVVADEVRTLAQRTQNSTSEIENLISALQKGAESAVNAMEQNRTKAAETVEQAAQAGEFLESITQGVSTILDMNSQIAVSSEEQAAVAQEINRSIVSIQSISDETSVGATQTSESSKEVTILGTRLRNLVEQFRV
ncbi:MAG: methyl-accepting chemotaxis protein [Oleiphilaceae bacterium]